MRIICFVFVVLVAADGDGNTEAVQTVYLPFGIYADFSFMKLYQGNKQAMISDMKTFFDEVSF